jgi:hypothetical protein
MNSQIRIFLSIIFFIVITISTQDYAQDTAKPDSTEHNMKKMDNCKDKSASEKSMKCKKETKTTEVSRINIDEVDKNKDGKVFQCPMCADQLADEPGKCSKCEMDLKEVSIEDAQKALDKKSPDMMDHSKMDGHKMDHSKMMNHDMKHADHDKMDMKKDNIVREGEIDLMAIDKNGDQKVFQDQMDWNVISDEAGECPLCGMKLKEVTLEKAKENLIKHGYKVKDQ